MERKTSKHVYESVVSAEMEPHLTEAGGAGGFGRSCVRQILTDRETYLLRRGKQAFQEFGFRLFFTSWLPGTCVEAEKGHEKGLHWFYGEGVMSLRCYR